MYLLLIKIVKTVNFASMAFLAFIIGINVLVVVKAIIYKVVLNVFLPANMDISKHTISKQIEMNVFNGNFNNI